MKKLLNILSTLSLTSICSLSLVSCQNKMPKWSLLDKENYIVQAINEHEIANLNSNVNSLTIDDISSIIKISIKWKSKHFNLAYDINLKNYSQSENIITQKYKYLIPEIQGSFDFINTKISNNQMTLIENINNDYQNIIPDSNLLVGITDDFVAIFDDNSWTEIYNRILDDHDPVGYINNITLKNPNINFTNDDWTQILYSLIKFSGDSTAKSGYSLFMHIKKMNNIFQVVYANLNHDGTTNMPYANDKEQVENNCTKFDKNTYQFLLNKNILWQLNDMFSYQQNLWTNENIHNLINNKMWLTNCNVNDAVNNFKILFDDQNNLNVVNQLFNDNAHNSFVINIVNNQASFDYIE